MKFQELDQFKKSFTGEIILPNDELYPKVSGTLFVKGKPAIILRPKTTKDIAEAITFIQKNNLVLSVRSGGHSVAGLSTNTDGAVVDLSHFNTVEILDKERRIVRLGAGARWGDVAKTLQNDNLALSSGDTLTVGVGGLTVGGGIGWMVRKYGLAIDSLRAAEIVTADGKILKISESENPDLFWAIRGGGGNFGIVTYFEFEAHPVTQVYAGMIMYPLDNLKTLLQELRDAMKNADEALTVIVNIMPSFGGNPPGCMVTVCYAEDDEEKAMQALEPFKKLGKVLQDTIKRKPYAEVLEEAHPPQGVQIIVRNCFIKTFNDEVIEAIVAAQSQAKSFILQIRGLGGAMQKAVNSTAFPYRDVEALLVCPTFLPMDASKEMMQEALKPWQKIESLGYGAYSGFFSTATTEDTKLLYSKETFERLVNVKKRYDPENIFNQNYNIKPSEGR